MNRVVLVGRAANDIQLRTTQSGKNVTSFRIAVTREFHREETDFINVVAWNKTAEILAQYVNKGDRVGIAGRIETRAYEDKQGNKRMAVEVIAENAELLQDRRDNGYGKGTPPSGYGGSENSYSNNDTFTPVISGDEDDLPF